MIKPLIGTMAIFLLLVTGCTSENAKDVEEQVAKQTEQATNQVVTVDKQNEIHQTQEEQKEEVDEFLEQLETTTNETVNKQINSEKNIVKHQVFIMEKLGIAGGELVVASEVNDDEATSLAEKISQQLKMEYPNLGISITVKRDDQEITTVELD